MCLWPSSSHYKRLRLSRYLVSNETTKIMSNHEHNHYFGVWIANLKLTTPCFIMLLEFRNLVAWRHVKAQRSTLSHHPKLLLWKLNTELVRLTPFESLLHWGYKRWMQFRVLLIECRGAIRKNLGLLGNSANVLYCQLVHRWTGFFRLTMYVNLVLRSWLRKDNFDGCFRPLNEGDTLSFNSTCFSYRFRCYQELCPKIATQFDVKYIRIGDIETSHKMALGLYSTPNTWHVNKSSF